MIVDCMVLGVIAALVLLAWQVIRAQRQKGGGCGGCGGCSGCSSACSSRDKKEETK